MYQHVSVHENDSKAKTSLYQGRPVYDALTTYKRSTVLGCDVRIKTYANNELRITFPRVQAPAKGVGSQEGVQRCFDEAEAFLVYSSKVQQTGEVIPIVPKRRRGSEPTRYRLHSVKEAGWIIEERFGKDAYFETLTHPGSTQEALDTLAMNSTGIVNALLQRHRAEYQKHIDKNVPGRRRCCNGADDEFNMTGVWEFQERGALHIHAVIGIRCPKLVIAFKKNHKKWWRKILLHYSKKTGVDLFARAEGGTWKDTRSLPITQFAVVEHSVSRYLSKYISKGAHANPDENWIPPAAWTFTSKPLMARVVAKRNLNAITFLTKETAEEMALRLVRIGQEMGGKVFPMRMNKEGDICGYVLFFDNDQKDEAYETCSELMEWWKTNSPELGIRPPPESGQCVSQIADHPGALEFFDGREINPRANSYADLCAPFSATEKGGGMR